MRAKTMINGKKAFTLLELMVVVAVVALLAALGSVAVHSAMDRASSAAEVSAGRSLVAALQSAAADNGGRFPLAFDPAAQDVMDPQGKKIRMKQIRERYPFRLAPYFGYDIDGTLLVGKNKGQIMKAMNLPKPEGTMYYYGVSAFPSLGINRHFVGGASANSTEAVKTVAQGDHSIIAFASAGTTEVEGYEYVRAPGAPGGAWGSGKWTEKSDPGNYGYVHPRHDGKAVVAFLDGSVKKMSLEELRDMRLWSRNAAINDDPNYAASE
ncbi:MAG: prepilin-type N-terminal cleavage/methylation domain-containing protein [Verrucomicrobia bacterium]|nr:prepilin-type N-terminal cleavage/methylation domain-containing protein [Verrucomicrobiota bacterium]